MTIKLQILQTAVPEAKLVTFWLNLRLLLQITGELMHPASAQRSSHVLHCWLQSQKPLHVLHHCLNELSSYVIADAWHEYASQLALPCPTALPGMSPAPKTKAGAVAWKGRFQNCPALPLVALGAAGHMRLPSAEALALAGCQRLDWLQHSSRSLPESS